MNNSQSQVKSESYAMPTAGIATAFWDILSNAMNTTHEQDQAEILPPYRLLYEQNSNMIGWLKIEGTVIDYPTMQTMEDEDYHLNLNFNKEENINGCLIMDTAAIHTYIILFQYIFVDNNKWI